MVAWYLAMLAVKLMQQIKPLISIVDQVFNKIMIMNRTIRYYHRYSCYINSNLRDLMMNHFYYVYLNACNVGFRGYLPSKSKIFGSLNSILEKNLQAIV